MTGHGCRLATPGRLIQTLRVNADSILFTRTLAHGPDVRVRRTSAQGVLPVVAVLEVDRRAGTASARSGGNPPPLMIVEGRSDAEVLGLLKPHALDDRLVAGLMRAKGQR